jgi:hypothetical protein
MRKVKVFSLENAYVVERAQVIKTTEGSNEAIVTGEREDQMLWTIAVILIILWLLGLVTGYTMGYFIHILLVVAIIIVLVRVIQGRRPL